MQRFFEGKKWVLAVAIVLVGAYARAQGTKDTLTLNLAKAIEIALSDNPTIKGEFYQFNLSSCIRQQNSLTAQFVSFSLSNLANIFYPPQFLQ